MDSKTEKKMEAKMKTMKKKELKELCQNLAMEQAVVREKYKAVETNKNQLEKALFAAIDAKDTSSAELINSKMSILKDELERLAKREKTLAEECELASKVIKNDYDGKSSAWMTVGAWIIGAATVGLSGWGLVKSHKSFEKGEMVDKATRGLAERMSGLFNFMNFRK